MCGHGFGISGNDVFLSFSLFCFSTIFLSVLLQIWREMNLRPDYAAPRHFSELTHIQATSHSSTSHPMTLHSPFPPNHTLPTHPCTHLSHPPAHTHTLPPYGLSDFFVQLCSRNILRRLFARLTPSH